MIEFEQSRDIWTIRLNRPEKANSLTGTMLNQLTEIVERAMKGPPKVVILSGSGKVFSAGADLDEARAGLATDPIWERLSSTLAALPCLTIAALNGTLAGGAFGMVLACDMRVAVPSAKFFYPVMKLGFLPQPSDPARLAALVGPSRTKMILMAGEKIDATTALGWGLIDRIAEPDKLMSTAGEMAADTLTAGAGHISGIKALVPAIPKCDPEF